jgi:hypothetical protein
MFNLEEFNNNNLIFIVDKLNNYLERIINHSRVACYTYNLYLKYFSREKL